MTAASEIAKYYAGREHPYRTLERAIAEHAHGTILDIGCGREAPVLRKFVDRATCIGIDPVATPSNNGVRILRGLADNIALPNGSVDLAYSRSVLEHLEHPLSTFREIRRVLRPGGRFIALTPNRWDYASVAASLIPNRFHPWIVKHTEGRDERDTFPTFYRANSRRTLRSLAAQSGFTIESLEYLNQYPCYLTFSRPLFWAGVAYERITSRFDSLKALRGWLMVTLLNG